MSPEGKPNSFRNIFRQFPLGGHRNRQNWLLDKITIHFSLGGIHNKIVISKYYFMFVGY